MSEANRNVKGKVIIESAVINTRDEQYDIQPYLTTISIFENIYSPYVYCHLLIHDYDELSRKIPLIGEEYLTLRFHTPGSDSIGYTFMLYKRDSVATNDLNNATTYVIRGITNEKALDSSRVVSTAMTGTVAGIADRIFVEHIQSLNLNELFIEPTKGITKFTFPSCTPLEGMEMMRRKAVSKENIMPSPYVFFLNKDGYHFRSLNTLFAEMAKEQQNKPIHTYGITDADPTKDDLFELNGQYYKNDIQHFSLEQMYDTLNQIEEGVYSNYSYSFDLTTKQFTQRGQHNAAINGNGMTLGTMGEYHTSKFLKDFEGAANKSYYSVVDFALELEGTTKDWIPEVIGQMNSYKHLLQQHASMLLYGDTDISAGQVISVEVPRATSDKAADRTAGRREDPFQSGLYLIATLRHDILIDGDATMNTSLTAYKGSYIGTISEMNKDE
jgi:hypothetical protein